MWYAPDVVRLYQRDHVRQTLVHRDAHGTAMRPPANQSVCPPSYAADEGEWVIEHSVRFDL
jgi:hypothetical protein